MTDLYRYNDYKTFLNEKLDDLDQGGRGARARMSRAIHCQTAYTAQVLRGHSHFGLEQGEAINDFLGHTDDEGHFFLLLLQAAKAGTPKLKSRFQKQIHEIQKNRRLLKNQLESRDELPEADQAIYYSSWLFGAVHALVSIPAFQTASQISARLGVEIRRVNEILEFLVRSQILDRNENGEIKIGKRQIHLGADSALIVRHHLNWRLQSMQAIEKDPKEGLHYSSVVSISKKDFDDIQHRLVEMLKEVKSKIKHSAEEELGSLCLDFYRI
jgi:uncharacterized protein (TIGR02147 family)